MSEDLLGGTVGGPTATPSGSLGDTDRAGLPLAVRMRPRTLEEILGQDHLMAPGSPLRRLAAGEPNVVRFAMPLGSIAIAVLGAVWLAERALGLVLLG